MKPREIHPFLNTLFSTLRDAKLITKTRNAQALDLITDIAELRALERRKRELYQKYNVNREAKIDPQEAELVLDFNVLDEKDCTPLIYGVDNNDVDSVKLLLLNNADPDFHSEIETPMSAAVATGNVAMVKLLVEHKADVNLIRKKDGISPLYQACYAFDWHKFDNNKKNNLRAIVKILCEAKADPSFTFKDDSTPLISAVDFEEDDVIRILLQHSANIDWRDNHYLTALDYAKKLSTIIILLREGVAKYDDQVLFDKLLKFNWNYPDVLIALGTFCINIEILGSPLPRDVVDKAKEYLKKLQSRHFLTADAYKKFIEPGVVTLEDLKQIYPEDKLIFTEYEKNFHIAPPANETPEAKLIREQKEVELQIKQQNFQEQFQKLADQYRAWGVNQGVAASALSGIDRLKQVFFNEDITGTQANEFFNSGKRSLEELYVLFNRDSIPLDKRKEVFAELCEGFKVCGPGIGGQINYAKLLLANVNSVTGWLAKQRAHIIHDLAAKYYQKYSEAKYQDEVKLIVGNKLHIDQAFFLRAFENQWAPFGEVEHIADNFIGAVGLNDHHKEAKQKEIAIGRLQEFDDNFLAHYTPSLVIDTIYNEFLAVCEAKVPEAFHQRWLPYPAAQRMIDDIKEQLKISELDGLEADFFDQKEDYSAIKFNPTLFKMRLIQWCFDQYLFHEHLWKSKLLIPNYNLLNLALSDNNNVFWIESKNEFLHIGNSTIAHPAWQHYFAALTSEEQLAFLAKINIKTFAPNAEELGMLLSRLKDEKQYEPIIRRVGKEFFTAPKAIDDFVAAFPVEKKPGLLKLLSSVALSLFPAGMFAKESKQESKEEEYSLSLEEIKYLRELGLNI